MALNPLCLSSSTPKPVACIAAVHAARTSACACGVARGTRRLLQKCDTWKATGTTLSCGGLSGNTPATDAGGPATARLRPWSPRRATGRATEKETPPRFFFFWKGFWSSRTGAARRRRPPRRVRADRRSRRRRRGPTELDAICAAWSARFTTTCVPPPSERARYGRALSVTRRPPRSESSEAPPKEPPGRSSACRSALNVFTDRSPTRGARRVSARKPSMPRRPRE